MNQGNHRSPDSDPAPDGVRAAAKDLAAIMIRQGLKFTALPALVLPARIRRRLFATAQLVSRADRVLPKTLAKALRGFAQDLDEMDAAISRREDLASRLRRNERFDRQRPDSSASR